jgi:hypothetical protein
MPALRYFGWPRRGLRGRGLLGGAAVPFGGNPGLAVGLAAYWSFNSSPTAPSEVGGFSLTQTGTVTTVVGKVGNGASIASGSYLSHAHNATLNVGSTGNGASFSLWANASGAADSSPFMAWDNGLNFTPSIGLFYDAGNARLIVTDDTGDFKNIGSAFSLSAWHHIVGTFTPGDKIARLYIDGDLDASSTATVSATLESSVGDSLVFGAVFSGAIAMAAIVDEAGAWDRALSLSDVQALYNGGAGLGY